MGRGRADQRGRPAAATDIGLRDALALCAADPVASVLAASRIEAWLAQGSERGDGAVWGHHSGGRLTGICWAGANLVPVCAPGDEEALDAFAETARRLGRRCSSIVGDARLVLPLWDRLSSSWGPAREVRADQPSMVIDHDPDVAHDPLVRTARLEEMPAVLPACVSMFTEEVGYSPVEGSAAAYEARVRGLVAQGRAFVRMEPDDHGRSEVVFKAELGAVSSAVAQVQGVWVTPRRRGEGLAAPGMAAVVRQTLGRVAPVVSLYVNDYNDRALATYRRVGFRQVGSYATVLF